MINTITEYKYFVTNNFLERSNRTLNENMIYKKSSFANFRNIILDTDYYFENKSEYNINNPSLSKAIIYYIKNSNYLDKKTRKVKLIDFKIIKDIYKTYTEVVKNSGLEMFDGIIDEDFQQKKEKIMKWLKIPILAKMKNLVKILSLKQMLVYIKKIIMTTKIMMIKEKDKLS